MDWQKTVVLTFDDTVANHATRVAPLLKELGFHATFFLCTGAFEFESDKEQNMTWSQIETLYHDGFELGNHTIDHSAVKDINAATLTAKIEEQEAAFAAHGIARTRSFAYPGGPSAPYAFELLPQLGFKVARSVAERAWNLAQDNPFDIPSIPVHGSDATVLEKALATARPGAIPVLLYHGIPDRMHPWVDTPPEIFESEMRSLAARGYNVLAFRDLFGQPELRQCR